MPVASALTQIRAGKGARARGALRRAVAGSARRADFQASRGRQFHDAVVVRHVCTRRDAARYRVELSLEVVKALGTPELRERLQASGVDPWPGTPSRWRNCCAPRPHATLKSYAAQACRGNKSVITGGRHETITCRSGNIIVENSNAGTLRLGMVRDVWRSRRLRPTGRLRRMPRRIIRESRCE